MDEQPEPGYIDDDQLKAGVSAFKEYIKKSPSPEKRDLLEAGSDSIAKVVVEVVFKNVPKNRKTYIHNIVLPKHWRLNEEPEDCNIAIFVRHRRPENEAQKIQFKKDRDLDIDNTHSYYKKIFDENLDENLRLKISKIISIKELATEFNTFSKLDQLSKSYDLFLADKQLMANKMNPLPRRLGRRFWVRERKVPLMVKLNGKELNKRFEKVFKTEPFYVLGSSSTEKMQVGLLSQTAGDLSKNIKAFLTKLFDIYGDSVRFIRLKTDWGNALPLYADLSITCSKVIIPSDK